MPGKTLAELRARDEPCWDRRHEDSGAGGTEAIRWVYSAEELEVMMELLERDSRHAAGVATPYG